MKELTVEEYKAHFKNTDHAEYVTMITNLGRRADDNQKAILKKGNESEKSLVEHGLVDEDGQLQTDQKSEVKKEVVTWFESMYG